MPCLLFIAKSLLVQKCFQLGFLSCSLSLFIRSAILLLPEYFFIDMPQAEATEKKIMGLAFGRHTPYGSKRISCSCASGVKFMLLFYLSHLPPFLTLSLSRSALICILFQLFCILPLFFFLWQQLLLPIFSGPVSLFICH